MTAEAMNGTGTQLVRIRYGTLRRGRSTVLHPGEISAPRGSRVALVGANGAGKTSLLLRIAGAAAARSELRIESGAAGFTPRAALAPQQPALPPWLDVQGVARLYGTTLAALERASPGLRIDEFRFARAGTLSTGQAQAVGIALALAANADVTLLDEPLAALDFRRRIAARDALASMHAGTLMIMSSQSARDVLDICEWIVVLSAGRCIFQGSIGRLLQSATRLPGDRDDDVLERAVVTMLDRDFTLSAAPSPPRGRSAATSPPARGAASGPLP